jgi:hypothetical protein
MTGRIGASLGVLRTSAFGTAETTGHVDERALIPPRMTRRREEHADGLRPRMSTRQTQSLFKVRSVFAGLPGGRRRYFRAFACFASAYFAY